MVNFDCINPLSSADNLDKVRKLAERLGYNHGNSSFLAAMPSSTAHTATATAGDLALLEQIRDVCISLDLHEQDYIIESEMQRLTEKVIKYIKINRELGERIDEMDGNIGLLIRNSRLALDEQALKRMRSFLSKSSRGARKMMATNRGSTKATSASNYLHDILYFNRDYSSKLQSYQHLFYALQTQPRYLARLLFAVPTFQVSSFFKNCIYSLFFCHPTEREVYLLCRLLREALREEIAHKVSRPEDIIEGDPVIITIALDCHRAHRQASFEFIKPVIVEILSHKQPILCLDPIALYKDLYLSSEGDISTAACNVGLDDRLLHEVSVEKALADPAVQAQLAQNIPCVIRISETILDIMQSPEFIESIPFGIRYLCKHMSGFLSERLSPSYSRDDCVRVIANVIFSRWIRPCILFPETYLGNARDLEKRTSFKVRRNLGGVCKLLQAAASGKKAFYFSQIFAGTTPISLAQETDEINAFLERAWSQFKQLVDAVCSVDEISDFIAINEFTDESYLKPPQITVTLQEIMEAHSILHKYVTEIAPNKENDPVDREFRQLIEHCGPPHENLHSLLNCDASYLDFIGNDELMSTEVTLKLRSRSVSDVKVSSSMTIRVKQALLELIKQRENCKDLNQVLFRKVEEEENLAFVQHRNQIMWYLSPDLRKNSVLLTAIGNDLLSLLDFTIANVRHTEARNFDEILVMIANDVVHNLQYREKRCKEMQRLESTIDQLALKREHLQEIHQYYEKYLNKCRTSYRLNPYLDRINHGSDQKPCFRYSASKLKEKGILVSLGDMKPSHLKKVLFEISPSPESSLGIEIRMHQRGTQLEKIVKLDLQYLLRLQYDGYKVVNLMGKAHINITHLLYFINCKFYVKKNR